MKKITSKPLALTIMFSAIVGGVGGALLLGHLLDHLARAIFELHEYDMLLYFIGFSVVLILSVVGSAILVAGMFIESKPIKIITIAFSLPIPIVIEVIDLVIRFIHIMNDLSVHYSVTF